MKPDINDAVDRLIQRPRTRIPRDDGTWTWKTTPSLWEMLTDSTGCTGGSGGSPSWASRLPISATAVDLVHDITTTCREAAQDLAGKPANGKPRDTPADLRAIAPNTGTELAWWTEKILTWGAQARNVLHLDPSLPRWVRGTPCPACGATHAHGNDGVETTRIPALGIIWHDTSTEQHPDNWQVRAVTCAACTETWFRGESMDALVDAMLTANNNHHTMTDAAS